MLVVTGGAQGTEQLAAELAAKHNIPTRIVVGPTHPLARQGGITPLGPKDMEKVLPHVKAASELLKKTVKKTFTLELLVRNYHIVRDGDCVYAFGKRLGEHVDGGTGWSVALALLLEKWIFVYDVTFNRWYKYHCQHAPQLLPIDSRFSLHPKKTAMVGTCNLPLYPHAEDPLCQLFDTHRLLQP